MAVGTGPGLRGTQEGTPHPQQREKWISITKSAHDVPPPPCDGRRDPHWDTHPLTATTSHAMPPRAPLTISGRRRLVSQMRCPVTCRGHKPQGPLCSSMFAENSR